jgi:predicted NAD/FAD-binding protein
MNAKKEEYRSVWRKVTAVHPEQTDQHLTLFLNKLEELIQQRPLAAS